MKINTMNEDSIPFCEYLNCFDATYENISSENCKFILPWLSYLLIFQKIDTSRDGQQLILKYYNILQQYPNEALWLDVWCREGIIGNSIKLKNVLATLNNPVDVTTLTQSSQYYYFKSELIKSGSSNCQYWHDIVVPKFLNDKTLAYRLNIFILPIICYCSNRNEVSTILKPIILSSYAYLYIKAIIYPNHSLKKTLLSYVFKYFIQNEVSSDQVLYLKLRDLFLNLSQDLECGCILRDFLFESNVFSELIIEISLNYTRDISSVVDRCVSGCNQRSKGEKVQSILTSISIETAYRILVSILTDLEESITHFKVDIDRKHSDIIQLCRVLVIIEYLIHFKLFHDNHVLTQTAYDNSDESLSVKFSYYSPIIGVSQLLRMLLDNIKLADPKTQVIVTESLCSVCLVNLCIIYNETTLLTSKFHDIKLKGELNELDSIVNSLQLELSSLWDTFGDLLSFREVLSSMLHESEGIVNGKSLTDSNVYMELYQDLVTHRFYINTLLIYKNSEYLNDFCLKQLNISNIHDIISFGTIVNGWSSFFKQSELRLASAMSKLPTSPRQILEQVRSNMCNY